MILSALVDYYEQMQRDYPGKIARPGWCTRNVGFVAEISPNGELLNIVSSDEKRGWERLVPEQVKRASGVAANFLCDTPTYMMGIDTKGKPERALKCFEAARVLHHQVLDGVDSAQARALLAYFDRWDPETAASNPHVIRAGEAFLGGGQLTFSVVQSGITCEVQNDPAVQSAWDNRATEGASDEANPPMRCLVTGKTAPVARLHPVIKGVYGAQSMGASLVGFNARSFESYGHEEEQGRNAPVSEQAARAYGAALNYLLASPNHHTRIGDTTVVYWAGRNDEKNSELFSFTLCGAMSDGGQEGAQNELNALVKAISQGKPLPADIDVDAPFYVLGIAPNAARLVVRFFLRDSLEAFLKNIAAHYERIAIAHAPYEPEFLFPWQLLKEVENPSSKNQAAASVLNAGLMRSILQNTRYPEALYTNALLRTRSTQDNTDRGTHKNTRGRAAIIKAYLIKNCGYSEEEVTVGPIDERDKEAYALGRAFAIMEQIQQRANGYVTIVNRYQNAACATPAVVFPTLLNLSKAHLAKIQKREPGLAGYFKNELRELMGSIDMPFPKRLDTIRQGDFLLGYYHQSAGRFKNNDATTPSTDPDSTPSPDTTPASESQEA